MTYKISDISYYLWYKIMQKANSNHRILTPHQLMNLPRNIPQESSSSSEQISIKYDYWYKYDNIDRLLKDSAQGSYHVIDAVSQDYGSLFARTKEVFDKFANYSNIPKVAIIPLNIGSSAGGVQHKLIRW